MEPILHWNPFGDENSDGRVGAAIKIDLAIKEYQLEGDRAVLEHIDAARERYRALSAALIKKVTLQSTKDLIAWGDKSIGPSSDLAKGVALSGGTASPRYQRCLEPRREMLDNLDKGGNKQAPTLFGTIDTLIIAVLSVYLVVVGFGLVPGFILSRTITVDMRKSVAFVSEIAGGTLGAAIDLEQRDEIGQ